MKLVFYLSVFLVLMSCKTDQRQDFNQDIATLNNSNLPTTDTLKFSTDTLRVTGPNYTNYEQSLIEQGFQDVGLVNGIEIDLKYTTKDNFTGQILYDSLQHAFLRPVAANKLSKALSIMQEKNPDYGFLIFDALRPHSVQYKMWDLVKGTEKERYVASPWSGSIHNFGCAVDLTIINLNTQQPLAMGSAYDYFGPAAEYRYNQQLLIEGQLSQQEVDNRVFFRRVMRQAGFHSIDTEWWHFNALSRTETRRLFSLVN